MPTEIVRKLVGATFGSLSSSEESRLEILLLIVDREATLYVSRTRITHSGFGINIASYTHCYLIYYSKVPQLLFARVIPQK